jgi:hypothetical protein
MIVVGGLIQRLGSASFTSKVTITAPTAMGSQKSEKIEQQRATIAIHANPLT